MIYLTLLGSNYTMAVQHGRPLRSILDSNRLVYSDKHKINSLVIVTLLLRTATNLLRASN